MRVNWKQLKNLDTQLRNQGWKDSSEFTIDVYLRKPDEGKSVKTTATVKFKTWLSNIYQITGYHSVIAIVVKDPHSRVCWQMKKQSPIIEEVPNSGHDHVVEQFGQLEAAQKRAWIKITEAAALDFIYNNEIPHEQHNKA